MHSDKFSDPLRTRTVNLFRKITPAFVFLIIRFIIKNKYIPNIFIPSKFNEKVLCKMLFDRDPRLPRLADKLAAREYVAHAVGVQYLLEVYAIWDDPDHIVIDQSWGPFVLKTNHGSGFLALVKNPAEVEVSELRRAASGWCSINYGRRMKEWCYVSISPKIFAEDWVGPTGAVLVDYKIFCFSGKPGFLKIISGMTSSPESAYCDLEFTRLPVSDGQGILDLEKFQKPPNFAEMIEIAASLSRGFDFLRVDLYNIGGRIIVGELTNYPLGAAIALLPESGDKLLGSFWDVSQMSYLPGDRIRSRLGF